MDVEGLLKELGTLDRRLADLDGQAGHSASSRATAACWPAWRILLRWSSSPALFAAWWREHGTSCEPCASACARVLRDGPLAAPAGRGAPPQTLAILSDASSAGALPYAADTGVQPESASAELPLVTFHRLSEACDPSLDGVWCVAWDNSLFVLLVGREDALAKWRSGASLTDSEGVWLGMLAEVRGSVVELLAPGGRLDGLPVLVLQSERSVSELRCEAFAIPFLLSGSFRLLPVSEHQTAFQALITDLTSRNRLGRFLAGLPEQVTERAEALTLSLYLRLLTYQGRLTPDDKARLARLAWLEPDIKEAFAAAGNVGVPL